MSEDPKPSKRCNNARHPTDVEDGYFSDTVFRLLHTREALRSEMDLQRGSQQVMGLQRGRRRCSELAQDSAGLMEEAEVGAMEEMTLKDILCQGPGSEPIGAMVFRLVTNKLAKHIKRGSKRSLHPPSTAQLSTHHQPNLDEQT